MIRKLITLLIICFYVKAACAQTCNAPGQTPSDTTALEVCGTATFGQTTVPLCGGRQVLGPCPTTILTDKNPFWYKFTCFTSGTLGFVIVPKTLGDDYDWQLYDVTNHTDYRDLYTDASMFVACNWSGDPGLTGASSSGSSLANCDGLGVPVYSSMPVLQEGHKYLLLVSHFTDTQSGYSLAFGGGTANITDPLDPHLKNATASCDGTKIFVKLNKKMKCKNFLQAGNIFSITPSSATVTSIIGVGCSNGFDMDSLVLTLDNPLPSGSYSITINKGNDGKTLSDICARDIPEGESIPLTVFSSLPTPMDSLTKPGCAPDALQLVFSKPILCSSIAADGSDFQVFESVSGNLINITGATGSCSNGASKKITIQLAAAIQKGGDYRVKLIRGSDGKTLLNECLQETAVGSQLNFSLKDTVSAAFNYTVDPTACTQSVVHYSHAGGNGVNSWLWNFNDNRNSILQSPDINYTSTGTKITQLIVSNGFCADTSLPTNIIIPDKPKADFEITDVVCPGEVAVIINNSTPGNINSWKWDFGNGNTSNQKAPPEQVYPPSSTITNYAVSLIVDNGLSCPDTLVKQIKVVGNCYIAVPSAFTPNNDGLNDFLYPLNAYKAIDLHFRVYNRFGQVLFETGDWTKKWDGTYKGQQQQAGTYVWTLQYTTIDTNKRFNLKGTTIMIR